MANSATVFPTSTESKICTSCGIEQPIDVFRHQSRKTGTRHNQCNDCHAAYQRKHNAKKRSKDIRTFVHQVPRQRTLGALLALVANIIKRFGGVDQFAEAWVSELNARMESKPGSKANLDSFRTISQLMNAADEIRQKERAKADEAINEFVTEDDLERVICEAMEKNAESEGSNG